jgi:hypothetical protein
MTRYKVELLSIDVKSEESKKDIQFFTFVDANDENDAVAKAKEIQKVQRPNIIPANTWFWSSYETAEKGGVDS